MHEKKQSSHSMRLNIGSASIIMLFAILCLTVLAALSLLSANSQWRLAERSADAVTEYYEADLKAAEIYARVENGDTSEVTVNATPEGIVYSYEVPINDRQLLAVTLREGALGGLEIEMWKAIDSADWVPAGGLEIWDGESLEG